MATDKSRWLQPGMRGEVSTVVAPEMTADHFGNEGVRVLATPYLIGLLENASVRALGDGLGEGEGTVGTRIDLHHEAATPVGMRVTATAQLVEVNDRRLIFEVEARDERERVAWGTHERFVVNLERFLDRVHTKKSAK